LDHLIVVFGQISWMGGWGECRSDAAWKSVHRPVGENPTRPKCKPNRPVVSFAPVIGNGAGDA